MQNCQWCGEPFRPFISGQRFCTHVCSDAFFKQERRQAVQWFRECQMTVETPATQQQQVAAE